MTFPKPVTGADLAEFLAGKRVVTAHHEAGHAVAAVLRGGVVEHIALGDPTDDGLLDVDREMVGRTRHTSARDAWSFIAFAGPWAQWRIETERGDADDMDLWDWLDTDALNQGEQLDDPFGDYALMGYDDEYGLPDASLIDAWTRDIDPQWPAIVAVAAVALAGNPVNTEVIAAIIERHT
jgi:hypothetical protein